MSLLQRRKRPILVDVDVINKLLEVKKLEEIAQANITNSPSNFTNYLMQAKTFVIAFVRKYSHKFSVNIEEKNMTKLSMLIKSFNTNVFLLSIIVLMLFIFFNKELISLMYKTSLKDINMMCLSFVFFEVIYLFFGCPQTIGMLSKYHYLFSKINFTVSILYFFSQLITIYLFGVWGGIFTFGFFYIIKNIIASYFIYKKFKIVTLNDFLIKIYRRLKYFI